MNPFIFVESKLSIAKVSNVLIAKVSNVPIAKVRSFATDLVRGLSSCIGQLPSCRNPSQNSCLPAASTSACLASNSSCLASTSSCLASNPYSTSQLPALNCLAASSHSQLLYAVKTKLAVQFSRQLLRRTTVNHLVIISIQIKTTWSSALKSKSPK